MGAEKEEKMEKEMEKEKEKKPCIPGDSGGGGAQGKQSPQACRVITESPSAQYITDGEMSVCTVRPLKLY